ncbi:MAG TPA: efflux RND transporter periplasmic adaptor subunit [Vicinamibacterales bacterium]|nr:efflux RND transporter periplasmic adaptor subunit [Vicinamibacterales bacterium]
MHTTTRIHLLILTLAAAVGAAACGGTEAETSTVETIRTIPVRTATVETRDLAETLLLTGTLDPRAEVTVVPEVTARIERVMRNEGDRVTRGQPLAVLDDADFRLARDRAKANLDLAEANRAHARAEKDRADALLKTGGITDKDHLAAQVAVQLADASNAQARTDLAMAERQLGRSHINAPITGRISKRHADAGTIVSAGTPLYTIVDDSVFELRSSVGSGDFGKLKVGGTVTVTVDALPGFVTEGEVNRISPQVDARSRSFEVIIRLPGRPQLVSGLFARAEVKVREVPGSLTVPPSALLRDGSDPTKAQTYVVAKSKAERRDVLVGVESSDAVQVTSGLKVGEVVVLDPPSALGPGTQVKVQ